jgi:DNA-directed RNA polymerase alpha subunit
MNLSDIKIGAPARRALENQNITSIEQLSLYTEKQLLQLHGFGPKAISILKEKGVQFRQESEQ